MRTHEVERLLLFHITSDFYELCRSETERNETKRIIMVLCNVGKRSHCKCMCASMCVLVYGTVERTKNIRFVLLWKNDFFSLAIKNDFHKHLSEPATFLSFRIFNWLIYLCALRISFWGLKSLEVTSYDKIMLSTFWFNFCFLCSPFTRISKLENW